MKLYNGFSPPIFFFERLKREPNPTYTWTASDEHNFYKAMRAAELLFQVKHSRRWR